MEPDEIIVVLVTAPPEEAGRIARELVTERACACVNVIADIRSIYRWEGEVQDDSESLLVLKTTRGGFDTLRGAVERLHPYDVPEILALPTAAANDAYAKWVREMIA
ncbi:MAG: divalent-cation tolerance protein CutA [Deltaproteobacteria bacterium]